MTRALLLPDGWDVKLHQVLVDLYLEAKGHPILKFVTIMNTIRRTDTDKLIFPAPPDPCRQYANRRLQYFIRKGRRPSVPDDALVHLLSAITLDESISLLMNRREALRQGSHIDSDNGTDDDDSDEDDDSDLLVARALHFWVFLRVTDGPVLLPFKRLREGTHQDREQKYAGKHKKTETDLCARRAR